MILPKGNALGHACVILLLIGSFLLVPAITSADDAAHISSEHMEYLSQTNMYKATGSVTITFGDATLSADEMTLDNNTNIAVITGNVTYRDTESQIKADRMEINLKTKLGTIYNDYVYYKKNNFHLRSSEINKVGEKSFTLDKATITTCDADPPAWFIAGQDISITQHERIKGWHGSFNINDVPVLYTPYFWAPLNRDRQTGFLFPTYGYSSTKGYYYKQGFYWAIAENQDTTVYADYYGKKGLGEGLDYRYIFDPETDGELWMYHVRDRDPSRSLAEIKSYHNQKLSHDVSGYLKLHAVSEPDYYEVMDSTSLGRFGLSSWEPTQFGIASEELLQKYLESDMHVSKQYSNGRLYFLAQGRQSLEGTSREVPQSLPEIGFVINTQSIKFLSFDVAAKGVNFWKETGQDGMRFDLYPKLFLSYGRLFNITQKIGARETVYMLNEPNEYDNRTIYDLDTTLTTKLFRKYDTFIHIIEPSLGYTYIPYVDQEEIPFFDSVDRIPKTNSIVYSITNRISGLEGTNLESRFRLSQSYSLLDVDKPFSPLLAEATLSSNKVDLSINASYDADDSILTDLIGSILFRHSLGFVGIGKNLRRSTDLDQYTFEAGIYRPIKIIHHVLPLDLRGKLWYDANNGQVQELNLASTYRKQCWAISLSYNERPGEYQIVFAVEFTGLGSFSLGSTGDVMTQPSFTY